MSNLNSNVKQPSMSHVEKIMDNIHKIKLKRQEDTQNIRYNPLKPSTSKKETPFMQEIYPKKEQHK